MSGPEKSPGELLDGLVIAFEKANLPGEKALLIREAYNWYIRNSIIDFVIVTLYRITYSNS